MASVDSTSTRAQVRAAMADNMSYGEDNSLSKAYAFVTACGVWLVNFAFDKSRNAQSEMWFNPERTQQLMQRAESWIASQPARRPATTGNVVSLSVENFRG